MIEGRTILCFASGYDAPPTSKHHVMHLLAERNTVLWVNYHASRAPTASASDLRYMVRKVGQIFRGITNPRKNLYVLTPPVLPLPGSAMAKRINRRLLIARIRSALARVGRGPVQVWSFTPDISYLLGHFGEEKVVYYCVDDHASFSGYDAEQVRRDEEDLCRRADLVVTTSMALQEAKAPLNPNTILVTHGVDYEHFSKALRNDLLIPNDIKDIPHPILGFFGLIRDWVDLDLLAEVCRRRPEWHIVMIGDSTVDLTPYRTIPNMHFLGRRPYEQLPAYCKAFDVGLIPFKINELTRAVNPIKLREYLAAGLPVVSTPLSEVARCGHPVHMAETPEAFVAVAEAAISQSARPCTGPGAGASGSAASLRHELAEAIRTEGWASKLATMSALLPTGKTGRARPNAARVRETARRKKVLVGVAGGGYVIQCVSLLRHCPPNIDVVLAGPSDTCHQYFDQYRRAGGGNDRWLFETEQHRQDGLLRGSWSAVAGTFSCLRLIRQERPDAVVAIGQRIAVFLLAAGRLVGVKTVFIECVTRVTVPSLTGRIISAFGLADRFYVQWPQARRMYRRALYKGRIL